MPLNDKHLHNVFRNQLYNLGYGIELPGHRLLQATEGVDYKPISNYGDSVHNDDSFCESQDENLLKLPTKESVGGRSPRSPSR